ncbi:MAG: hypothetical protein KC897_06445 [Candidatus Omnitrophica bacterium]|nr:hypothetical protein [Candidatus Omnitrophota bacterium]MCB9719989.1 hypothetical protein [Candidatus Omnitrophota bacterium]
MTKVRQDLYTDTGENAGLRRGIMARKSYFIWIKRKGEADNQCLENI